MFRDADDTKQQIEKKGQALSTAAPGSDLLSVQALQRQHKGFVRDLAPLGEKVRHTLPSFPDTFLFTSMPTNALWVLFPRPLFKHCFLCYSILILVPCP